MLLIYPYRHLLSSLKGLCPACLRSGGNGPPPRKQDLPPEDAEGGHRGPVPGRRLPQVSQGARRGQVAVGGRRVAGGVRGGKEGGSARHVGAGVRRDARGPSFRREGGAGGREEQDRAGQW